MRCDDVQQMIEEGVKRPPAIQAHLASCSACREYLRQWGIVRAGLLAVREEELPQPSVGFTTRLIRRLESASTNFQTGQQFIDQIGRRFVYATLMVALVFLLALILPSSGPFRSSGISESVLAQAQMATVSSEQILGVGGIDSGDASSSYSSATMYSNQGGQGSK